MFCNQCYTTVFFRDERSKHSYRLDVHVASEGSEWRRKNQLSADPKLRTLISLLRSESSSLSAKKDSQAAYDDDDDGRVPRSERPRKSGGKHEWKMRAERE